MSALVTQDPTAAVEREIDWSDWLRAGDTISTGAWAATPSTGVTVTDLGENGNVSQVRASGLTFGKVYRLKNTIVTANGETGVRSIIVRGGEQ